MPKSSDCGSMNLGMPHSYDFFNEDVVDFVNKLKPKKVLDVGPGAGKYGVILRSPERTIDAIEIHAPYVGLFRLAHLYSQVFIGDVRKFEFKKKQYDLVILGDVLEHLTVGEAQTLLHTLRKNHIPVLVTIPYLYPHPAVFGNPYEEHKQADLTDEVFHERYPGFRLVLGNKQQGIYYRGSLMALPDPEPEVTQ